jgi:hypothetical protein
MEFKKNQSKLCDILIMNTQLNEVTSSLISLVYDYQRISDDNEKIRYAVESSELLELVGNEESSTQEKLKFCSYAVEAITSEIMKNKAKIELVDVVTPLDKEEVDFIQYMMFIDADSTI